MSRVKFGQRKGFTSFNFSPDDSERSMDLSKMNIGRSGSGSRGSRGSNKVVTDLNVIINLLGKVSLNNKDDEDSLLEQMEGLNLNNKQLNELDNKLMKIPNVNKAHLKKVRKVVKRCIKRCKSQIGRSPESYGKADLDFFFDQGTEMREEMFGSASGDIYSSAQREKELLDEELDSFERMLFDDPEIETYEEVSEESYDPKAIKAARHKKIRRERALAAERRAKEEAKHMKTSWDKKFEKTQLQREKRIRERLRGRPDTDSDIVMDGGRKGKKSEFDRGVAAAYDKIRSEWINMKKKTTRRTIGKISNSGRSKMTLNKYKNLRKIKPISFKKPKKRVVKKKASKKKRVVKKKASKKKRKKVIKKKK